MSNNYPSVTIKNGREKSIKRFHPWVFSGSIDSAERELKEGELIRVIDEKEAFLGIGHCAGGSLSIKILTFKDEVIDQLWFDVTIEKAAKAKKDLGFPNAKTNAFRLVHGEGDGLPGLIIDIYDKVAVMQFHSVGMELSEEMVVGALQKIGHQNILIKPAGKGKTSVASGEIPERITVLEHGIELSIDVLNGQKTGFFLDQRDSRFVVRQYAKGRKVLNVFSYTGGFSISALKGGAISALSVDSAQKALDIAQDNARLSKVKSKHTILKTDALPYLENMTEGYDLIILDPPAFAKHKSARHNAIQAYRRINEAALRKIEPGGLLFTFSCSQVIDTQLFSGILASAAINVGRQARIVQHLRQPADHAVSIFHPEGSYLKGLVLMVD